VLALLRFVLATRDREPKTLRRFFRIVVSKMKSSAQDFWPGAILGKRLHLCGEHQFDDDSFGLEFYLCECRPA
jgi:hypothetical protein